MMQHEQVVCPCGGHWTWEQLEAGECELFPPPMARLLREQRTRDIRHAASGLVTSSALIGCPRSPALSRLRAEPVLVGRYSNMTVGTGVHELLARVGAEGMVTEHCTCPAPLPLSREEHEAGVYGDVKLVNAGGEWHLPGCGKAACTFTAELEHGGERVLLSGRVDALRHVGGAVVLYDWKVRNPNARRYAQDQRQKDAVQVLVNARLAELSGLKVDHVEVWTCYLYEWRREDFVPLDEQAFWRWMLETPAPGEPRESLWQRVLRLRDASRLTSVDEVLQKVPPVGEKLYGGRMCSMYCPWDAVCHPRGV